MQSIIKLYRSISFRGKVFFILLCCSLLSLLVGFRVSFSGFSNVLESELAGKSTIITKQFARQIEDFIVLEDEVALRKAGKQFYDENKLGYLGVYDSDGYLVVYNSRLSIRKQLISSSDIQKRMVQTSKGEEFFEVIYPVRHNEHLAGYIRILFSQSEIIQVKREMFYNAIFIVLILVVVIVFVSYWGGFFLIKPLDQIVHSLEQVSQKNYTQQLEPLHIPEFDLLIQSFNQMTEQLNKSFKTLNAEIDNRKQVELQLRSISNNIPNTVIYRMHFYPDGYREFKYVSDNIKKVCQLLPRNLYNDYKTFYSFFDSDYASMLIAEEQNALLKQHVLYCEVRATLSDGEQSWFTVSAHPTKHSDGSVVWDGIIMDITTRKQAETDLINHKLQLQAKNEEYENLNNSLVQVNEDLILAKEKAEDANNLKTAFLQNISHEVRTPLNGICGFTNLLPDVSSPEEQAEYISIIQQSSKQLLGIVTDILTVSSLETKQMKVEEQDVCINTVLKSLFSVYKAENTNSKVDLRLDHLLKANETCVYTDETKLTQILSNLLSNALKFTSEGVVVFGCQLKGAMLEFYVMDTGIGIAKSEQANVFERFRQAGKDIQVNFGGTGLGLSISKGFVELLGGNISIESELGEGCTFRFTVPYNPVLKTTTSTTSVIRHDGNKTVLVAEDEDINFQLARTLLNQFGVDILHAKNGKEAVEIFENNSLIDLILMDIKMPELDGFSAAKIIKDQNSQIPIVALSAYAMSYERQQYEEVFDGYLSKPIAMDEFNDTISSFF